MKKFVYFSVVDSRTLWELNERYSTEAEARNAMAEAIAEGDCPNPLFIQKTVCTMNAKGKVTRKDNYTLRG